MQDHIRFVVGPLGSAAAVATRSRTTEGKVITMTLGFTPRALGADAPYAFRPVITTGEFSDPQMAWVLKTVPVKNVKALLPNDEVPDSRWALPTPRPIVASVPISTSTTSNASGSTSSLSSRAF